MNIIRRSLRLWRTIHHLRPIQLYGRLWFNLFRPLPDFAPAPECRQISKNYERPARKARSLMGDGVFFFLNEKGSLAANGWDDPKKSKLWRYNQHYFDDLNARNAEKRGELHRALILNWITNNPPGQGTGWEPYPTSLRIVNWIKWTISGNNLEQHMQHSLAVQIRWLMRRLERHLLGNHLFANAKALVYAGLFFDGPEANRWLTKGLSILDHEIPEQILSDGGHFELSPMYHALAVEDMLDLVNIARAFGRDSLVESWETHVPLMLHWLLAMTHPDGNLASFNDTAKGIAPSNSELLSFATRLGFSLPSPLPDLLHLTASGYARLQKGPAVLITDLAWIGPDYLPGHAHADTLSFELSLHGHRLIVNSGTSVYGLGPERRRQRGTAAHSTLTIDSQDSSEVWSGFRVGRRAYPLDLYTACDESMLLAEGAHNGYQHLPGAPIHRRKWRMTKSGLEIIDQVNSSCPQQVDVRFYLASGYCAEIHRDGRVHVFQKNGCLALTLTATGATPLVEQSTWHPQFGQSLCNQLIRLNAYTCTPQVIKTQLDWTNS